MAIKDNRLKEFFSKQKVGAFDALLTKRNPAGGKTVSYNTNIISDPEKVLSKQEKSAIPEELSNTVETKSYSQPIENNKTIEIEYTPLANRNQIVSEPLANRNHTVSKALAINEHSVTKPSSESLAYPLADRSEIHFDDLMPFSKKERELITLIFWQCRNNGTLVSPPITTEEIRNILKITAERLRNLIFRIVKKGGLRIKQHKSGQSAYRVFELPKSLYQVMIDSQNNQIKRYPEPLAQPLAQPLANTIYSSSKYINTTTSLPEEWNKINFGLLQHIGFSETQLRQLYDSGMTVPEVVQDAINCFAYSLEHNDKTKAYNEPLNVLMGVLRKGQRWIEPHYVPPQELALRQILEEKRKQKEQYDAMIKELMEIEFPEWRKKLTEGDIKQIVPAETLKMNISAATQAALRTYFMEKVLLPKLTSSL